MFENVIGYDFIKSELGMFYDLVANREKYKKLGIDSSKNVYLKNILIEGSCGTGKTTIAKDFMNSVADIIKTFFVVRDNHDGAFVEEINDIFRQANLPFPHSVLSGHCVDRNYPLLSEFAYVDTIYQFPV